MNNLKIHFKNNAKKRREIFSSIEFNKIYQEREEKRGFKKSKAKVDKLYKEWKDLNEALITLEESLDKIVIEAQSQGLTDKEITRLSLEALDELDLEEKQR
jgi:hypothetical protein